MAFGKPQRRTADEDQRVLPLINVVFLLLIFFMVAGQLAKTDPVHISPPQSDTESESGERMIQVLITAGGRILVGGEDVAGAALPGRLKALLKGPDSSVHVKADGDVDAVAVIAVLDQIKKAGASSVHLLTRARQ